MSRIASSFILAAAAATVLAAAACTDGEIAVGMSDQQLVLRKDGTPTGDGKTCSWQDTVAYDGATGEASSTPAEDGPYAVGDTFESLDGCNDCSCTSIGIMCTQRSCGGGTPSRACPEDGMICPDGSYVVRTGPNCEFAPCAGAERCHLAFDTGPCDAAIPVFWFDASARRCVPRTYGGCEGNANRFSSEDECVAACASSTVCDADAKLCPDGSYVGRVGPSCEFAPCPG